MMVIFLLEDIEPTMQYHEISDTLIGLMFAFLVEEVPLAVVVSSRIEMPSGPSSQAVSHYLH